MTTPTTYRSNCLIEAFRAFRQLRRQGARVALFIRPSDADDRWLFHVGWQVYDPVAKVYRPSSFRPVAFVRRMPVWQRVRRALFLGHVVDGDDPPPPETPAARTARADTAWADTQPFVY